MKFVLASSSPRRRTLLESIGIKAEVLPSKVDESVVQAESLSPSQLVSQLAMLKSVDVARAIGGNILVIGADTIVYLNNKVLTKPKSLDDAKSMLSMLSGRWHEVYTGYAVTNPKSGKSVSKYEVTKVKFRDLDSELIENYVNTREPMDKAGAYGIQNLGSILVEKIEGDYFNVVGLPLCALAKTLKEEFDIDLFKERSI